MTVKLALLGDINLMGVEDPSRPFARIGTRLKAADLVFANLECAFFEAPADRSARAEGFYAHPDTGEALTHAGVSVVGNANNVNYGPPAIRSSIDHLERMGIAHTGAGRNAVEARRPVILERHGVRFGFLQRTSVFWTHGHEAEDDVPGVAVLPGHTAYKPRVEDLRALTRPGYPPEIVTWADPGALAQHRADIDALRGQCDILVASQHWGLDTEVLRYQRDIAQNAIDAGADIVFGHGPHATLAIEWYQGAPVFYGAGSFSFETGHFNRTHPDWLGLMVEANIEDKRLGTVHFQYVRHTANNETVARPASQEKDDLARLTTESGRLGAKLTVDGERVAVSPA